MAVGEEGGVRRIEIGVFPMCAEAAMVSLVEQRRERMECEV